MKSSLKPDEPVSLASDDGSGADAAIELNFRLKIRPALTSPAWRRCGVSAHGSKSANKKGG
jgi:hypothetical protein